MTWIRLWLIQGLTQEKNSRTYTVEQAWELSGGSEDQLTATMMQISQVVAEQFKEGQ